MGEADSSISKSKSPPFAGWSERKAWSDWVGSAVAQQEDETTRARIQAAFAAGFEAGWRQHLLSLHGSRPPDGADKET